MSSTKQYPVIAIDGPAGVGKGTLAKKLAACFEFHYLDSGAVYRILAHEVLVNDIDHADTESIERLVAGLTPVFPAEFGYQAHINGTNIDSHLRSEECSSMASKIASLPSVRAGLLDLQRSFQKAPGLVGDGRDLGTVVFPNAAVKIFLDAEPEERARRRHKQLIGQGISASFDHLLESIRARDERDRTRSTAPLAAASDAWVVDSTNLSIEAVVELSINHVQERLRD